MFGNILFWILIWFVFFGVQNLLLLNRGLTYTKNPFINIFTFLIGIGAVFSVFLFDVSLLFQLNTTFYIILFAYIGLEFSVYFLLKRFTEDSSPLIRGQYSHIKYSFLIVKGVEVLYQDIMIFLVLSIFSSLLIDNLKFVFLFSLFFGLIHSPLLLISRNRNAKFLVISSFALGFLLPLLYIFLPEFNLIVLYILHSSFYLLLSVTYRINASFRNLLGGVA